MKDLVTKIKNKSIPQPVPEAAPKPISANPLNENTMDELWTEKQVAEYLGLSVSWCQRKRWLGGGPIFAKIGHNVRYPKSKLILWVQEQGLVHSTSQY